jgi:hypothetical protein
VSTAAQLLHGQSESEWVEELEHLVDHVEDLSLNARAALRATVEAFLRESDTPDNGRAERLLNRLSLTAQSNLRARLQLATPGGYR